VEVCSADRIKVDSLLDMSPDAFRIHSQLYKILLPPPRGEQGATGIILANGRGTISEKGHSKICGKRIK
jgi:hypothetical protein